MNWPFVTRKRMERVEREMLALRREFGHLHDAVLVQNMKAMRDAAQAKKQVRELETELVNRAIQISDLTDALKERA